LTDFERELKSLKFWTPPGAVASASKEKLPRAPWNKSPPMNSPTSINGEISGEGEELDVEEREECFWVHVLLESLR